MIECKNCETEYVVKSGFVRGKQRYKCKKCGCFFTVGDERTNEQIATLKALCALFYSMGNTSYSKLGKLFGRDRSLIYRWVKETGLNTKNPTTAETIGEIKLDNLEHFINSQKTNFNSKKPLIVAHGKLWFDCPAIIILQPTFNDAT